MKALILVENYPSNEDKSMMFVHVRNKYYAKQQIDVVVLSFKAKKSYEYEGIKVISLKEYKTLHTKYDILICHAANLKHHYVFLSKYQKRFKKIVFFYHGHEILKINEVYPADYKWKKRNNILIRNLKNCYDDLKLFLWNKKIQKLLYKSQLIFVSEWLYHRFLYYVHINPKVLEGHVSIINNSVGESFECMDYDFAIKKEYDFITIRGNALDCGKYGIDIVTKLAEANQDNTFLVIGKGDFYKYNEKPKNLKFIEGVLTHQEMLKYLDKSRCVLLLTKQDTQGVMTCEVATYGIPTITSDIQVCKEMFENFENVKLINNNENNIKLNTILIELEKGLPYKKNEKFFAKNTIQKEVELLKKMKNTIGD